MTNNMLFAIARSPEGKALVDFARLNGVTASWENCRDGIKAMVTGNHLGNAVGTIVVLDANDETINNEFLIHLSGPHARCVVNLATVLAMAAAYVQHANNQAKQLTHRKSKPKTKRRRQK